MEGPVCVWGGDDYWPTSKIEADFFCFLPPTPNIQFEKGAVRFMTNAKIDEIKNFKVNRVFFYCISLIGILTARFIKF